MFYGMRCLLARLLSDLNCLQVQTQFYNKNNNNKTYQQGISATLICFARNTFGKLICI